MTTKIEFFQEHGENRTDLGQAELRDGADRSLSGVSIDGHGVNFYKVTDGDDQTIVEQVKRVWDNPSWNDGRIDELISKREGLQTSKPIATLREHGGYHDLQLRLIGNLTNPQEPDISYTARITHLKSGE